MTTTLGSYQVGEVLGRGSMGAVHKGVRAGADDQVALKVLRPELVADPEVLARFLQERSMLYGLVHPNVVRVHDLVVEAGSAAIVMDMVDGSDLRRILNEKGTLPPAVAANIVLQVLSALSAVHAKGIVHLDIKPENVLMSSDGEVRLTDFGCARLTTGRSLTRMSGLIGTPEYLAPELAEREDATPSADIYATGILFYELLAGLTPFAGGHPVAVLRRHIEDEPRRPVGIPNALWALLASMLAKDPVARPSAEEARRHLATITPDLSGLAALAPSGPQREGDESPTLNRIKKVNREQQSSIRKESKSAAATTGSSRGRAIFPFAVAAVVLVAFVIAVLAAVGHRPGVSTPASATRTTVPMTTTTMPTVANGLVSVVVANATDTDGLAADYTSIIRASGFTMRPPINANHAEAISAVYYKPGLQAFAEKIATSMGLKPSQVQPGTCSAPVSGETNTGVAVVIGEDLASTTWGASS